MRVLFLLAGSLLPATLLAQVDLTLQLGYGSGFVDGDLGVVCITYPCASSVEGDGSPLLGAVVDVPVASKLAVELRASHQQSKLHFDFDTCLTCLENSSSASRDVQLLPAFDDADLDVTQLQVGLRRHFELGRWEPFGAFGVGGVRLRSDAMPVLTVDTDRFAASLAGGARRSFSQRWGVRLEARTNWLDLPEVLGGSTFNLETSAGVSVQL